MAEDDIDETDDELDESPTLATLRKELKEAGKRQRDLEAERDANAGAARRIAFLDAGIPDTPQAKFFREHYSGDLDPEAIKTAASEHGFIEDKPAAGVDEMDRQSEAAYGAEGNIVQGSVADLEREIDEAARNAPRGQTSQAIDEVVRRHRGRVG